MIVEVMWVFSCFVIFFLIGSEVCLVGRVYNVLWMLELCVLFCLENVLLNIIWYVNVCFLDEICVVFVKVDCVNKILKKDLKNIKMVKYVI